MIGLGVSIPQVAVQRRGGGAPTPTPTSYVGLITNNTVIPNSLLTSGQVEDSHIHTVRNSGGQSDIRVGFPGWYVTGTYLAETDIPTSYTVDACAVEYPVGSGTWYPVLKGGLGSWTVNPGPTDYSDLTPLGVTIPNGADYRLYHHCTGANIPLFSPNNARALYTDEGCNRAAGSTSTPKAVTDNDTNRRYRTGPVIILGTMTDDSLAISGDSQTAFVSSAYGLNTGSFADHNRGDIPSALGQDYGYVNLGVGGDQWTTAFYSYTYRLELARRATVIVLQMGINEFNNRGFTTAAAPLAYLARVLPMFKGKKIILASTTERTTGAWTLADGSDQTLAAYSPQLPVYAAGLPALLGGVNPLDRYGPLQNATTVNKWAADGTVKRYSEDGIHLSDYAAHTYMKATVRATWVAQIAALTVSNPVQPAVTLTSANAVFAGGKQTSGTNTLNGINAMGFRGAFAFYGTATANTAYDVTGCGHVRIFISTGLLRFRASNGNQVSGTTNILDGVEHHIEVTYDGATIRVFIDGAIEISSAQTMGPVQSNVQFTMTVGAGGAVRGLSIYSANLHTADFTPPAFGSVTAADAGLIAYWPLTSALTGIAGAVLPQ